jgi:hypothetical protein
MTGIRLGRLWTVLLGVGAVVGTLSAGACGGSSSDSGGAQDGGSSGDDVTTGGSSSGTASSSGGGGDDGPPSADTGSQSSDGGGSHASVCPFTDPEAGTCNGLQPTGTVVPSTCSTATPATPAGGTVVDGLYTLDSFTHFGSTCPAPDVTQTTWVICGATWVVGQTGLNGIGPDASALTPVHYDFHVSLTATSVAFTQTCMATGNTMSNLAPRGFTATDHDLTFIYPDPLVTGGTVVSHYLRQ